MCFIDHQEKGLVRKRLIILRGYEFTSVKDNRILRLGVGGFGGKPLRVNIDGQGHAIGFWVCLSCKCVWFSLEFWGVGAFEDHNNNFHSWYLMKRLRGHLDKAISGISFTSP